MVCSVAGASASTTDPPTARRYERERGKDRIQILTRLVPNIFHEGYSPAVVETLVDRMRANVYTAEAPEPLDLLQLVWWDLQVSGSRFWLAPAQPRLTSGRLEMHTRLCAHNLGCEVGRLP